MKDKFGYILVILFLLMGTLGYSQMVGKANMARVGDLSILDTAESSTNIINRLLVDDFESAGEWSSFMPRDYGITMAMIRQGAPVSLQSPSNQYVLGVKTEFMKRDWSWITITPARPTRIKGLTKNLTVWVAGRAYQHTLTVVLRDYMGYLKFLSSEDKLTWIGWRPVKFQIPDSIKQEDYKVSEERGITFIGFRVDFNPEDIKGSPFYIYFDWLTAYVGLFNEEHRDEDDMLDNW